MVAAGKAERHHILPESGWVSMYLRQVSDVERAIELLRFSFERLTSTFRETLSSNLPNPIANIGPDSLNVLQIQVAAVHDHIS